MPHPLLQVLKHGLRKRLAFDGVEGAVGATGVAVCLVEFSDEADADEGAGPVGKQCVEEVASTVCPTTTLGDARLAAMKLMVDAGRITLQQAREAGQLLGDRGAVVGFEVAKDDMTAHVDEDVEVPAPTLFLSAKSTLPCRPSE